MAYLEIKTDDGVQRVPLGGERLSIGRLTFNDIALPSPQISRQHAELRRVDGAWWIADLNSTNGLHLRGRRIQDYCLTNGDEISLAPSISVRFVDENALPDIRSGNAPASALEDAVLSKAQSPAPPPRQARLAGFTTSEADDHRKTHPVGQRAMQVYPPVSTPEQLVPSKPRSIYADDEVPFFPGMAAPASAPPDPTPPARNGGSPTIPYSNWNAGPLTSLSSGGASRGEGGEGNHPGNGSRTQSGGYPVLPGALESGSDTFDPYRRSGALVELNGSAAGAAGNLLHVCQTCGQLTSPNSVYCQSCHHSIAHECVNCRLSLLPIQDRCPRCHTPNDFSVRRAHPGR